MSRKLVNRIMKHYQDLSRDDEYAWLRWNTARSKFTVSRANSFFIGVLLDQGQIAERAWDGAEHLVANHFQHEDGFWKGICQTSAGDIKGICQKGFDGKSYALRLIYNKFPIWLRNAAERMIDVYKGDPRNIWKVDSDESYAIYERLKEFDGIGDALAKMGQFILVRNYGVCGGSESQHLLKIKPDELVRRAMFRSGLSKTPKQKDVIESAESLKLKSPADFDAALWLIGRTYCLKTRPKCEKCPINRDCQHIGLA